MKPKGTSKNNLQIPHPRNFLTYSNVSMFNVPREWGNIDPELWFWRKGRKKNKN